MRFLSAILLCIATAPVLAIELNGSTDFALRATLNSSISARVAEVKVVVGQRVTAGEVLLTLVSTGLQANADIARAKVNSLVPRVDEMLTELEKAQELFDRDSLALVELQRAEQGHAIAVANLAAANAHLARALFRLSQAELRSPIEGIVLNITTFPGQFINTRTSDPVLLTIVDDSSMITRAQIPIELWSDTLLRRPARVSFLQQEFNGEIVEINRQATIGDNSHPSISLMIRFKTDGKLPAGLPVRINFADD